VRVIICGAGRVGYGIAAHLASENNTVTVIDVSADLVRTITTELDVRGVVGHGAYPHVLKQAGLESADMIIAVTYSDEVNMVACQVAHSLFKTPTKVARVRSQPYLEREWNELYTRKDLPIDIIISPEVEIGKAIRRRLKMPGAFNVVPFADGRVRLLGVRIAEECPLINTPIRQIPALFPDLHAVVVGIEREGQIFATDPDDSISVGDNAYFISQADHAPRLLKIVGNTTEEVEHNATKKTRHVVIIGGGNIGLYVASGLENTSSIRIRIIERDKKRAEHAAKNLKRTVILNGDALLAELQEEADIQNAEAVLCLTNDDKTNILSGVLAKKLGAKSAIVLINEISMQFISSELPLDTIVDPRATTVSSILRHVRRGRILDVYTLSDGQAEVLEGEVLETSSLVGKTLKEADNVDGIAVGAIIHDGQVQVSSDSRTIKQGDRLILLTEKSAMKRVEQMFRANINYF